MRYNFNLWELLAGLTIFIIGMNFLSASLKSLAGRRFKLFLKKHTSHKLRAVGGGAIVTAVLQSSSVVNLMVLAFVSAGIISMQNALAVMLGSNLGTTLSSWLIVTLGFKISIESFAFPLIGVGGILMMIANQESRYYTFSRFLTGFGFLFIGLGFMKSGVEGFVTQINLSELIQYPGIVFIASGVLITALIQSSSATIAIVLTALYSHIISLPMAAYIVLGSEIGTTVKLLLASSSGPVVSKRVALGNFLINIITVIVIFILLNPILRLITQIIQVNDPLIALVLFQSLINIASIILFLPFLKYFGRFLNNRFPAEDDTTLYINKVRTADTELAVLAFMNETRRFLEFTFYFSAHMFDPKTTIHIDDKTGKSFSKKHPLEMYDYIKNLHGKMHSYYVQLQSNIITKEETESLDRLIASVRNGMYAAKSMKDVYDDINQLRNSSNDRKFGFYIHMRDQFKKMVEELLQELSQENGKGRKDIFINLYKQVVANYNKALSELYHLGNTEKLSQVEISTIINFNREIYTCLKSLLYAIKGWRLSPGESAAFDELPGFIR
ncbi:MAG: hypothetical protein GC171_15130 [Terrimonas sp.]|nr:hypothetical protein [Terrimonas sp.]